ncbi:MAG: hypothetical protein JRK26_04080 [Deltaproteobacteria bacterium]|nr:hypothetical protein [Deltaproteobacteria bacterium]
MNQKVLEFLRKKVYKIKTEKGDGDKVYEKSSASPILRGFALFLYGCKGNPICRT